MTIGKQSHVDYLLMVVCSSTIETDYQEIFCKVISTYNRLFGVNVHLFQDEN
jgi:hypothetical protein